jgi:nucleolar protein 16
LRIDLWASNNRDQSLTLAQNYRRLGLTAKINRSTGGVEKNVSGTSDHSVNSLAVPTTKKQTKLLPGEARIERAPDGSILRVTHAAPIIPDIGAASDEDMADEMTDDRQAPSTEVVRQLEEQAKRGVAKAPRTQSVREQEWVEKLVAKYGDDYKKMFWDRKLNPMQQSEGDIRKRVLKWKSRLEGRVNGG